ncbi:MAG: hypothetical protein AB8B86_14555 [Pseudomonadales bacterium]
MDPTSQKILESDEYLLYRLNEATMALDFVACDQQEIRNASFLDARFEGYRESLKYSVPLASAMKWLQSRSTEQRKRKSRLIFHVSFCGSTLLSRAIESEHSVTFKEPQALTDLEVLISRSDAAGLGDYTWQNILELMLTQFVNSSGRCNYVIKTSNLLNAIAPQICELNEHNRAIFLSMSPRNFLIAVLRGGSERVDYIFRLLENLSHCFTNYTKFYNHIDLNHQAELDRLSRKILLAHAIQELIFTEAAQAMDSMHSAIVLYEDMTANPLLTTKQVSSVLDLNLSDAQLQSSVASSFSRHSKVRDREFTLAEASATNKQVLEHYGPAIEEAIDWYAEQDFAELNKR